MEHIINVAFDFDDKKIEEYMEKQAINDVQDTVTSRMLNTVKEDIESSGYRSYGRIEYDRWMGDILKSWLDEHEDEVIKLAALALTRRVGCKKTYKDALDEAVNELKAGNDEQTTTPSSEAN